MAEKHRGEYCLNHQRKRLCEILCDRCVYYGQSRIPLYILDIHNIKAVRCHPIYFVHILMMLVITFKRLQVRSNIQTQICI